MSKRNPTRTLVPAEDFEALRTAVGIADPHEHHEGQNECLKCEEPLLLEAARLLVKKVAPSPLARAERYLAKAANGWHLGVPYWRDRNKDGFSRFDLAVMRHRAARAKARGSK